jgi:Domain of unknown function (DUF4760)
MDTATAALIGAALATAGWLYTARRARTLSRKQHSVSVMLQASFNSEFQGFVKTVAEHIKANDIAQRIGAGDDTLRMATRRVLNHYEFIASGLRNGDFDERLVMDSERSAIIQLFAGTKEFIGSYSVSCWFGSD